MKTQTKEEFNKFQEEEGKRIQKEEEKENLKNVRKFLDKVGF